MFVVFVGLGSAAIYLRKHPGRPSPMYGIRTQATRQSPEAWTAAQVSGGRSFMWFCFAAAVPALVSFFLPLAAGTIFAIAAGVVFFVGVFVSAIVANNAANRHSDD